MNIQKIHIHFEEEGTHHHFSFDWQSEIDNEFFTINSSQTAAESTESPKHFLVEITPKVALTLKKLSLTTTRTLDKDEHYFVNGYQTWTDSREFVLGETLKGLNNWLKPINKHYRFTYYGDYFFWNYANKPNCFHSYSYTYFRKNEELDFWASLNENTGFTIFYLEADQQRFSIIKDCKELVINSTYTAFDLLYQKGTQETCWDSYAQQYTQKQALKIPENKVISGWTSWYYYYTDITPEIILENLSAFASRNIPIDVFQIDDGYQQAVGDWLPNEKFEGHMKRITQKTHKDGYKAGLWIAPFICEEKSKLKRDHPDWILKYKDGKEVVVGYSPLWSGKFYALDFENEAVQNYLEKVFDRALKTWNFDMLKLDFLYAVCMAPPKNKTKGQVMNEAMQFLRKIAGDKLLLGCGVPLASSFGLVDYCRIGADVALKWEDKLLADVIRYRERVSTLASLHNTISRHSLNARFFGNDPDVFILREAENKLTQIQKNTLFILNQLCGSLIFTSDNINEYNAETLELYRKQFPQKTRTITNVKDEGDLYSIEFKLDGVPYCLCANLSDTTRTIDLPKGTYFSTASLKFYQDEIELNPFETQCLKRTGQEVIEVIGSTAHLFPGADIESVEFKAFNITLKRNQTAIPNAKVYIKVPAMNMNYWINEEIFKSQEIDGKAVIELQLPHSLTETETPIL